ncbi:hypothetical protein [Spiroplasma turonicum]|uniref:DUF4238 domain-containing protein n=1 Tax=Spiroplasma turonicum TaxID=216946 RepID=A0A0K1P5Z2_9MOLU|nr:hypothetical protein [Spiroplasma turonicum]AKU79721.1 hypothetical protein STURON_00475 [Spiroplasma turonicum]ALX70739.1 hypothetical protein STURO_v1c04730 [Spiroplasma turonicum]
MEKKVIKKNLILPTEFLDSWISKKPDGSLYFKYIDFETDNVEEIDVVNESFIKIIFDNNESFDSNQILKQYNQIAKVAKAIVEKRLKINDDQIKLTSKELLFLKYFYFLITILNGEYKFSIDGDLKKYRTIDVLDKNIENNIKNVLLNIISYVIFEMYDYIFSKRTFESLYDFIESNGIQFNVIDYEKTIIVPLKMLNEQNYKFIDFYFHNVVNNTFFKFFKVSNLDRKLFLLTNKTIANFIDNNTKKTLISFFVVDPKVSIGVVNLGPGRGEYRPYFRYFTNNIMNKKIIPHCLIPEHVIEEEGISLTDNQRFYYKSFELTEEQVQLINDCLTYRDLKSDFENFIKFQTNKID